MGLFEDIWDWMKSLVQGLINANLTTFKSWVNSAIKAAIDAVDWVITNISNYVTNVYKTVNDYVTNVYNNFNEYVTNVYNNVTKYITNKYYETTNVITNIIGASTEWVENQLTAMRSYVDSAVASVDTVGFFKDPLGYIEAAFLKFIEFWVFGVVGLLAKGIIAGVTEEEPGIHGAGESFIRGFNSVIEEAEE